MMKKILYSLVIGFLLTGFTQAATLVTFDWDGGTNNNDADGFTPDTIAGFSVSALSGFTYQTNVGFFNGTSGARHDNVIRSSGSDTDTSSFTTSGTSGQTITYESFEGLFSDSTGDIRIDLSYSIGGGGSVAAGTFNPTGGSPLDASGSAFDFTDFSTDQSVVWTMTFTALNNSIDRMRFDDLTMTGTVVPEPSTFALLSLGLGSLVLMRRRR